MIELPDGTKEGYGFYPKGAAGIWEALGVETEGVVQDDTTRPDTSNSVRYDITEEQYEAVKAYIEAFEGQPYDLYAQNCAHFAKGGVEAAGIEPPRAGWLVTWPEGLEQGMESVQKAWAAEAEDLGEPVPEPVPTPTSTPAPQ